MKAGGFWYRWLHVRKCECCGKEVDTGTSEYYRTVPTSHRVLCETCFGSCSMADRRWKHMVVRL